MEGRPLLKTLRTKKRYVLYHSTHDLDCDVYGYIVASFKKWFGLFDYSKAGIMSIVRINGEGIIKVNTSHLDKLKYAMTMIKSVGKDRVLVKCVRVSGMMGKLKRRGGF